MSASQPRWHVIRSPAAPARRAGRAWDYGLTEVDELTDDELDKLRADQGYTVIDMDPPATDAQVLFPTRAPKRLRGR